MVKKTKPSKPEITAISFEAEGDPDYILECLKHHMSTVISYMPKGPGSAPVRLLLKARIARAVVRKPKGNRK